MTTPRPTRCVALAIVLVVLVTLGATACTGGPQAPAATEDETWSNLASENLEPPSGPKAPEYGARLAGRLTIGYVYSGGGAGKNFGLLANGGQVVPALASKSKVDVRYEDDHGTADGARLAVSKLVSAGAAVIVYASIGEQLDSGIKAAAKGGVPVILPYSNDPNLVSTNTNAFTIALTRQQIADKLVDYSIHDKRYRRFGIVFAPDDPGATAEKDAFVAALGTTGNVPVAELARAAGRVDTPAKETEAAQRTPPDEILSVTAEASLGEQLATLGAAGPDAIAVFGSSQFVFEVLATWQTTGLATTFLISPSAATPTLSQLDMTALAPPLQSPLSVGLAGGPWIQTPAIMNFYRTRDQLRKTAGYDLSVADILSADAGVIAIAAAEKAGSSVPKAILAAMAELSVEGIGATYTFGNRSGGNHSGVNIDDYAITAYIREESAQYTFIGKQYPDIREAGGYFVAVEGTAPTVKDLDPFS